MQQIYLRYLVRLLLAVLTAGGLVIVLQFIRVDHIRGDEFLSWLHSDTPQLATVFGRIRGGADHSYTHAGLLWIAFQAFGHTMLVQRGVSLVFWLASGLLLFRLGRRLQLSHEAAWLAVLLTLFSNLGIFLAADGRCYSMLLFISVAQCSLLLHEGPLSKLQRLGMALLVFSGWLTSLLIIPLQLLLLTVLLIAALLWRQRQYLQTALQLLLMNAAVALIYLALFRIQPLEHYYVSVITTLRDHHADLQFLANPLRWVLLPHLPGSSQQTDAQLSALILIASFSGLYRQFITKVRQPGAGALLLLLSIAAMLVIVLQFVLHLLLGVSYWPPRYYAMLFWFLPVSICLLAFEADKRHTWNVVVLLFCLGMGTRLFDEYQKIGERDSKTTIVSAYAAAINSNDSCKAFIAEQEGGDYTEFAVYGELYIRKPGLRNKLVFLCADESDPERYEYFMRCRELNYPLQVYGQHDTVAIGRAGKPCLLLKSAGNAYQLNDVPEITIEKNW